MGEEEICLPQNHPLRQYLEDIGISDTVSPEVSKKPNGLLSTLWLSSQLPLFLEWIKYLNFSFSLQFNSPFTRLLWFRNINLIRNSDLITAANILPFEYLYCTRVKEQTDVKRWIFIVFPILTGLIFHYSAYLTIIFVLIILYLLLPDIFLIMSKHYLAAVLKQMEYFTQGYRVIVLFLQDLNTRRYFGPKIVDKETFQLFPIIYHQTHSFMLTYILELIDFCVKLDRLVEDNAVDGCLEIPFSELVQLKMEIEDKFKDSNIENLKMFGELSKILTSDFLIRLSSSLCKPTLNVPYMFRLDILLWKWNCFLAGITNQFNRINELHTMIMNGKLVNINKEFINNCSSTDNENKNSHCPEARITYEILLHLLVSVEHANNLKSYVEQNSEISLVSDEQFSKLVNLVRCQLNASMIFLNELDHVHTTENNDDMVSNMNSETTDGEFLYYQNKNPSRGNVLKAEDPIAEDDAFEEIAVGDTSDNASDTECKTNEDMDPMQNPSSLMHISVLKELKNVILHRRIIMQEREECALRRRLLHTDFPENKKQSVPVNSTNPTAESEVKVQLPLENSPVIDLNSCSNDDKKLSEFFSTSLNSSSNSVSQNSKHTQPIRRDLKSSVLKRNMIFNKILSPKDENYQSQNYANRMPLTNNIFQSENSSNDMHCNDNNIKIVQRSALANALFAQRKLLGLADEDCFTG
ncbi:unnamed protein product [Trichobilharzia szidati]|nr:unnamed protein product [Trichobilharzia szidati]